MTPVRTVTLLSEECVLVMCSFPASPKASCRVAWPALTFVSVVNGGVATAAAAAVVVT